MKSTIALLVVALALTGCSVSGPKVTVDPGSVKVKPISVELGTERQHCPPGHAKKNWC